VRVIKKCKTCEETKQLNEFYKSGKWFSSECKICSRARSKEWRKNNPQPKKKRKLKIDKYEEGFCECPGCETIKSLEEFGKDSSKVTGYSYYCKECINRKARKYRNKYYNKYISYRRNYREENYEKLREQDVEWCAENRDKRNASESKRRARQLTLPNTLTTEEWNKAVNNFKGKCALCEGDYEHMDHFIPLATGKVGTVYENMVPLCSSCNLSKGPKNPFEWIKTQNKNKRERFDTLVRYLSDINGIMDVEDYKAYVYKCFE